MRRVIALIIALLSIMAFFSNCDEDDVATPKESLTAIITEPADNAQYSYGDMIIFSGAAADPEDGILPDDSLKWTSDKDGQIGSGTLLGKNDLSLNRHVITLTVHDSDGNSASDNVTISVNINGNDYYPIDIGNVWNYNIATVEVADDPHAFTDGIGQRVNTTRISGPDEYIDYFDNVAGHGVAYFGSYEGGVYEDDPVDGLFIILKNVMTIGDTWKMAFSAAGGSSGTFTFLGLEWVNVPAGSFTDCIKIEFTLNDDEPYTDHLYFAKDVGLVKAERISPPGHTDGWFLLVTSDERLAELQSATIGGVSYP